MGSINSLEQLLDALQHNTFGHIAIKAEDFLRQSAQDGDPKVKQLLLDILDQPVQSSEDAKSVRSALVWLGGYHHTDLVPVFLKLLVGKEEKRPGAIIAIIGLIVAGVIQPGDPTVTQTLLTALAQKENNHEMIIRALGEMKATQTIDILVPYLAPENNIYLRTAAVSALFSLGREAGRKDILEKIIALVDDPDLDVHNSAISCLHTFHRELFKEDFNMLDFIRHWRPGYPWRKG